MPQENSISRKLGRWLPPGWKPAALAAGALSALAVTFSAVDFIWKHPARYAGGPDIPLSGDSRWALPSADDFDQRDIRYLAGGGGGLVSGVLARDTGNYVFVRIELRNDFELARGQGKDLVLVFTWGKNEESGTPIPGLPVSIGVEGGWRSAALIRDNASSSLWGREVGEVFPTHVERTYFDHDRATITLVFSKLLLVSTGWDGAAPVSMSALVLRDGGDRLRDYEVMGRIAPNGWGVRGWSWRPEWVTILGPGAP